jgi:hypothetical protein
LGLIRGFDSVLAIFSAFAVQDVASVITLSQVTVPSENQSALACKF